MMFETAEGCQHCTARLILITCDLPARAMLLCMKNHNGKCSCCYCHQEGVTVGDDHLHRYWPYDSNATPRSHDELRRAVIEAVNIQSPV